MKKLVKHNMDRKNRYIFKKRECFRKANYCMKDVQFTKEENTLKVDSRGSLTVIRNRCLLTGKSNVPLCKLKLSRNKLREFALFGFLVGVKKAVW